MFRGLKAFKQDTTDFLEKTKRGSQKALRETARGWFGEVVTLTPKDTGFASSMWKITINKRPPTQSIKHPGGSKYAPAKTPTFYKLNTGDTLYLYNNVEYIVPLEHGHSKQAPKNFFHNSAMRADRQLQRRLNKL